MSNEQADKMGIVNFDLDFHFQKTGFKVVS